MLLCALSSCKDAVLKEYKTFPMVQWKVEESIKFTANIQDTTSKYDLIAALRHSANVELNEVALKILQITPSGKQKEGNFTVKIRDEKGFLLGSAMGEITDTEQKIVEKTTFSEIGNYTFEIRAVATEKILPIAELGLIIQKNQ